jgi:branched-chain amino acid transport system substrate-binding protein
MTDRSVFLRTALGVVALWGMATLWVGCGGGDSSGKDKDDGGVIYLGVAGPFTGPQAKIGTDMAQGVDLAVAEWNERGGVSGKTIVVIRGDDEAQPKQATAVAQDLVAKKVVGVVGHFNSGCSIPASEIYNDKKIVMISPASTNPRVTERGYKGVFRVCGRDDQQGTVAGKFAIEQLKARRIAILHDKTTYGEGLAIEFKKTIESLGVQPVYFGGVSKEELDFRAVISAIKAQNPDLWYFGGIYDQGGPLLNQARQAGLNAPLMSGDGLIDKELIKSAGKNAEGTFLTFGPDPARVPTAKEFIAKYRAKYGEPGPYSVYGYDAANVLLNAIAKSRSTKFDDLADFIHRNTFDSAMGPLAFDEKGDIRGTYYIMWIVKDGEFVVWEKNETAD